MTFTHTATAPTATVKVVRYYATANSVHTVHVVRSQEPGELAVWTIHRNGNAPIYVALTRADAFRVADFHAGISA
jgi:predicted SnoaL-like aldol condensation-catalyzing enzyme